MPQNDNGISRDGGIVPRLQLFWSKANKTISKIENPASAGVDTYNCAEMVELVDTPGLEPGAVRCAGSSPVLGKYVENWVQKKVQKSLEICF